MKFHVHKTHYGVVLVESYTPWWVTAIQLGIIAFSLLGILLAWPQ